MERDPAFLWETEAVRASRSVAEPPRADTPQSTTPGRPDQGEPAPTTWLTPDEAAEHSGLPLDTIVRLMLTGAVRTHLDVTVDPPVRKVDLASVLDQPTGAPAPVRRPPTPSQAPADTAPPGTMIVPVAAWDKMLMQLGNLHEAGQELAAARERAAKAETEATFLRERLAEMRAELERVRSTTTEVPVSPSQEPEAGTPRSEPPPAHPEPLWKTVYGLWRSRRR